MCVGICGFHTADHASIIFEKYTEWVLLAFVGIAMALLNGIPMYMGVGINNDGRNIPVVSCGTTGM